MRAKLENGTITDVLNNGDKALTIPAEVTNISETLLMSYAFDGVEAIRIEEDNPNFVYTNGCLINIKTKTLLVGLNDCIIPDDGSVEVIGPCALGYNTTIDKLTIPEGVRIIEVGAFSGSSLQAILLPRSLELVRGNAFGVCERLHEVTVLGENTKFEPSAFGKMLNDGSPMPRQISSYVCPDLVVKGYRGSPAEDCAEMNGIFFEEL